MGPIVDENNARVESFPGSWNPPSIYNILSRYSEKDGLKEVKIKKNDNEYSKYMVSFSKSN